MTEPTAVVRETGPLRVVLQKGEALAVFRRLPGDRFEGLFCDPPYGLGGEAWDWEIPPPDFWREAARVLCPGAWVLAFGGRRTHHRLMAAMEAGGLELCDVLSWIYATGMPRGGKTTLRPAWEPVILARRPGPAVPLDIDACRTRGPVLHRDRRTSARGRKTAWGTLGRLRDGERHHPGGRWPTNALFTHGPECQPNHCGPGCPVAELDAAGRGASRFFYCAKPAGQEVAGNPHPTKKPVKLCAYLARLILPPGGGRLAVPFCGSGSEILGGLLAGWREVLGVERELRWLRIAERRLIREIPGVVLEARA